MKEQVLQIEQAVNVLDQALNAAATKGIFNLKDSALVNQSLDMVKSYFTPLKPNAESVADDIEDHTEHQIVE
jgi:hypothetical protein